MYVIHKCQYLSIIRLLKFWWSWSLSFFPIAFHSSNTIFLNTLHILMTTKFMSLVLISLFYPAVLRQLHLDKLLVSQFKTIWNRIFVLPTLSFPSLPYFSKCYYHLSYLTQNVAVLDSLYPSLIFQPNSMQEPLINACSELN